MQQISIIRLYFLAATLVLASCSNEGTTQSIEDPCDVAREVDHSRGDCDIALMFQEYYSEEIIGDVRVITANNIPEHHVGLFGHVAGALNPNPISEQSSVYHITTTPVMNTSFTPLLSTSGTHAGPQYSFGILLNGVELDPVAAEPFPHHGAQSPDANWEWNLEALNVDLGLDCNNAHVQPSGKYHYHGPPTLFLEDIHFHTDEMTVIGYAADGFPIYYEYAYSDPMDTTSAITAMSSSYQLKAGDRPGDGVTAPCGPYDGIYSNDYEYVSGLGTLDVANGRFGITPEYPAGTYYYVITDEFPGIPRYFRGTPSIDFKIGM